MTRLIVLLSIVLLECIFPVFTAPSITHISPTRGGSNGGTRLTLHGTGFPASQFNWGDGNGNIGSYVELVSGTQTYPCDRHIDGCTATQITCDTRRMPIGDYTLKVKVDGVNVAETSICAADKSKCVFKTRQGNTPTITELVPTSGQPNTKVTIYGYIVTDVYGSQNVQGDAVTILRVYNMDKTCNLKNESSVASSTTDNTAFYGIYKDDNGVGNMTCFMGGSYVGSQNLSFIIKGPYGRSGPILKTFRVSLRSGRIGMYETYAGVNSVSPTSGSTKGGTLLTITGNYFDNTDSPVQVKVGGQNCTVQSMTTTEIKCVTQSQPASQTLYPGNRGLLLERWTQTSGLTSLADLQALQNTASDHESSVIDSSSFPSGNYAAKLSGYFYPTMTDDVRFHLKAPGKAWLLISTTGNPSDKAEVASVPSPTTSYWTNSAQTSTLLNLQSDKFYYIELLYAGSSGSSDEVSLAARFKQSPVTASMCGDGRDEIQVIIINSTVEQDKQTLTFSNMEATSTGHTAEVQTLTLSGISGNGAKYRIGLFGAYTRPIDDTADGTKVEEALNDLASLYPYNVTVADNSPSSDPTVRTFVVTFNTPQGNVPAMDFKDEPKNSITSSISETTSGVASRSHAFISFGGNTISSGIPAGASANEVKTALYGMFGAKCPPSVVNPPTGSFAFFEDFEDTGSSIGEIVSEIEPLCGRYSVKKSDSLTVYQTPANALGYRLATYPNLCFGYSGEVDRVKVQYDYTDAESRKTEYFSLDFLPTTNNQWSYNCLDIETPITDKNAGKTLFRVWEIDILNDQGSIFYVDQAAALKDSAVSPDIGEDFNFRRYPAAKPGGQPVKAVTVTGTMPAVTVTMETYECAHGFNEFAMADSQTTVTLATNRVTEASPPVKGTVEVMFKGNKATLNVTGAENELETALQTAFPGVDGIGQVKVEEHGDCANKAYFVTFLTNRGDQEEMTKGTNNHLTGNLPSFGIETRANGGLFLDPIQGNILETSHIKPQVTVSVNNVPSKCTGTCDFEYSATETPTITASSPDQGTQVLGTILTVQGTGFSTVAADNQVTIGGVDCPVISQGLTTISLTCTVGNGPMGTYDINLNVAGKGLASGSNQFTYTSQITGISPTSGSLGGGTLVSVSGNGFAPDAVVQVGGNACTAVSNTPSEITCLTPRSSTASAAGVTVVQNGNTVTTTSQFTYDQALTPTISSINPQEFSVFGGESMTIQGSGFGALASSPDALKIGDAIATIQSYSDTQVIATLPPNDPGQYNVLLTVGSKGYANPGSTSGRKKRSTNNGIVEYVLKVTDIFPPQGSLYGGTDVTIFGQGFGTNASIVDAKFGPYSCEISSVEDTKITCRTGSTARTHQITNDGSHPSFGKGYAWEPLTLDVNVGDTVRWTWNAPTAGSKYSVIQKSSNGFSSGPPTEQGAYERTMTAEGNLLYWSGYTDSANTTSLHGNINVFSRQDSVQNLKLVVGGYEANYDVSNRGQTTPANTGTCTWDVTPISNCQSLSGDATKFWFKYQSCNTPRVTLISRLQGASTQTIDVLGEGFSTTPCQNEIRIGDYNCGVTSSTSQKITCKVDTQQTMPIGDPLSIDVRRSNLGQPSIDLPLVSNRTFILLPHISNISPAEGSTEGGVTLTVTGGGFIDGHTVVKAGQYNCPVLSVSYSTITCTTPRKGRDENVEIKVQVTKNNQEVQAVCSDPQVCAHYFKAQITPTVTSVSPTQSSGSTTLTIAGTLFGTDATKVTVQVGGVDCSIQASSFSNTQIICTLASAPVGNNKVSVLISNVGYATSSSSVTSQAILTSVNPTSGSTQGNTSITITGNGFVPGQTKVTLGGKNCTIASTTLTSIICFTPAGTGAQSVTVESNGVSYSSTLTFTYDTSITPMITNVQPSAGKAGDTITITGSSFSADNSKIIVSIGGTTCPVSQSTLTSIICSAGSQRPGQYSVSVNVDPAGLASSSSTPGPTFTYEVTASSVSPIKGSLGGGHVITITGTGFNPQTTEATVCGSACKVDKTASSSTQLVCETPVSTATVTTSCDVVVSDNSQTATLTAAYQYDSTISPQITGVSPTHGSTGGGTTVTITGSGFSPASGRRKRSTQSVTVKICGVTCTVQTVSSTQVICVTQASTTSSNCQIALQVGGQGNAIQNNVKFFYIWPWSSTSTWGGKSPPAQDEFVIIPVGMTILLDVTTPKLRMLLIRGHLIFDEKDIELNSEYILITDGGSLQVGTEAAPFQHKATITLYGNARSSELPIYGAKVLAVRNGTLDLHGKPVSVTWTVLSATADVGATTLTLKDSVDWPLGSTVVIATTGHRHSQKETETRKITAVSADGRTITLNTPLSYKHVSVQETYGSVDIDMRAEVGLLSRNVKVQGSNDLQWSDTIKACPDGFDTGEFVTQTCFQGRFGDEVGSDQFGGQIIMHAPDKDKDTVVGRLSYTEITYAGQAFRLGRYPVHFHLLGVVSQSYVKGCAIHHTFNRATNIHGTHNVLIENNVVYNVMGGALFLEDGIETGNVFKYNLALFVKASSSLLNDDITPASYWVTNPNNTYLHNHAAGGTHFGFWYRMHEHPDGPSFDPDICPRNVPLGEFNNNTVHSFGWFGLWIFHEYTPRKDGSCSWTAEYETAVFRGLVSWNNEKGAETVNSGNIQFDDFRMVHNEKAGIEIKLIVESHMYNEVNGSALKNSVIVGRSPNMPNQPGWSGSDCTIGGIVLPYGNGLIVAAVKFYNFDKSTCSCFTMTKIDGTCTFLCSGFTYHFKQITCNGGRTAKFEHGNHACFVDEDGSLSSGAAGTRVVPTNGDLPSSCTSLTSCSLGVPASQCPMSVNFIRMSFNNPHPSTLKGSNVKLINSHGHQVGEFAFKRITHPNGWAVLLVAGETYDLEFVGANQVTNISYSAVFSGLNSASIYVIICQKLEQQPDRFSFDGSSPGRQMSSAPLDINNNKHGDWYFNNVTMKFCYMVAGKMNKKRATVASSTADRPMQINALKCYYPNCIRPVDPNTVAPTCTRPTTAKLWSLWTWGTDSEGYIVNDDSGTSPAPVAGQKVKILKNTYVIGDTAIPALQSMVLFGTLDLDHDSYPYRDFVIDVTYLYIKGGRLIGGCDELNPYRGKIDIILRGDHSTPPWPITDGPNVGAKAIGAFGPLDLHGLSVGVTRTYLAATVQPGATTIQLEDAVEWVSGGQIVIAATGFNPKEAEVKDIQSVSSNKKTITLTSALKYKHIASTDSFSGGRTLKLRAEVGYLTRPIKIIGGAYSNQEKQEFGARLLVGTTADTNGIYTGYARLSNVEFRNAGQFGWTESYDPRYALSFLDIGTVTGVGGAPAVRPCYVKSCSFHHIYNAAIGVFNTHGLPIENTVIHDTVHNAIVTSSTDTFIKGSFLSLNQGLGTYHGRNEAQRKDYSSSIYAVAASKLVMQDVAVTGFEGLGYRGPPEDVPTSTSTVQPWRDNVFHTGLIGAGILGLDNKVKGFNSADRPLQYARATYWKCWDAAIFYHSTIDINIEDNTFADNGVSVFPLIYGADPLSHICKNNVVNIKNNLIVGESSSFDCATDKADSTDPNIIWSAHNGRSWRIGGTGKSGVSMGWCISSANSSPDKPLFNTMSYNAICCKTVIRDNTFANFKATCNGGRDVAITTPPKADDAIHPVYVRNTTLQNVEANSKLYIHRPRVASINPSDCVDMPCDGHKKVVVTDEDGTLLGTSGGTKVTALAQAEWQWDGDARYGTGYYRVPKAMMLTTDGKRISNEVRAKYKGMLRDQSCVEKVVSQAWFCTGGYDYYQLVIENMDADTETRRLSPVGVLGWDVTGSGYGNGYIDLINGPQDHGWCAGYTCQKRISTFTAVVVDGRNFSMYFTSTSPQYVRYRLLNPESTTAVRVQQFINTPHRISVYCNGVKKMAINAQIVNGKEELSPTTNRPDPTTGSCGDNYMDYDRKELHMIVKGDTYVEYRISPAVFLGFNVPSVTVDQFFGPNLVNNLAALLNVPSTNIRIVNIQTTGSSSGRKKRSTGNTIYYIEISESPCNFINCTGSTGTLSYEALQQFAVQIINSYQAGNLTENLNITTLNSLTVAEPLPSPTDTEWALVVEAGDDYTAVLKVPHTMIIREHPQPASEGNPFTSQPKIHMLDILGEQITKLGASTAPWKVTAQIVAGSGSNSLATLIGTTNVSFVDGWANFTDLGISHDGSGYIIQFTISYPEEVVFSVTSSPLDIPQRSLSGAVVTKSSNIQKNAGFSVVLGIMDGAKKVDDINWKGHLWQVTASLANPSLHGYGGGLTGTTVGIFDPTTGEVQLNGLQLDTSGIANIKFIILSNPAGYQFELDENIEIISEEYANIIEDTTKEMKLKVDLNCDTYCVNGFAAAVINGVVLPNNPGIRTKDISLSAGSVVITTTITGNTTTVQQVIDSVCGSISAGTTFTYNGQSYSLSNYMTINGATYYGVSCGETSDDDDKAKTGLLIAIIVCVLIIIALVAGIVYWRCVVYPKTKTHRFEKDPRYLGRTGKSDYEDILWREDTFQSLREKSWIPEKVQPPITTTFTPRSKEAFTGHM